MLTQWLTPDRINIVESVDDWRQAITLSAAPLLAAHAITEDYISAIFQSHREIGPYYVLSPGLAMPHARPEQGAKKTALSLLHVKQGVCFHTAENDPIYVIIFLSALNGDEHLNLISQLAELFSHDKDREELLKADTPERINALITRY